MEKQSDFILRIAPKAQEIQSKYGVPASLAIAQAALETGWGDSVKGNNYFGIKAGKTWAGVTIDIATHEYVNGKRTNMNDSFRAYSNMEQSVENYGRMLATSPRYSGIVGLSAHEAADELQRAGYATDPKYASKLKDIINTYNLTRFDDPTYTGYMNGERFEQTRQRLRKQRDENPEPWAEFFKSFVEIISSIFSGLANLVFGGSVKDNTSPSTTPMTSKVAAIGQTPRG